MSVITTAISLFSSLSKYFKLLDHIVGFWCNILWDITWELLCRSCLFVENSPKVKGNCLDWGTCSTIGVNYRNISYLEPAVRQLYVLPGFSGTLLLKLTVIIKIQIPYVWKKNQNGSWRVSNLNLFIVMYQDKSYIGTNRPILETIEADKI